MDYCGGSVLPLAIDQRTVVCIGRGIAGRIRIVSTRRPGEMVVFQAGRIERQPRNRWATYAAGASAVLDDPVGYDAAVAGDVPEGAGLSSSAALAVSSLLAAEQLNGRSLAPLDRVLAAQRIEHECAGVPCGVMDHYIAVFARPRCAMMIDCRGPRHRELALPDEADVVIVDSGVKHDLAAAAYAQRRAACESARLKYEASRCQLTPHLARIDPADADETRWLTFGWSREEGRRVRHVVSETARVEAWARALASGDLYAAGRLMLASHASLRDDFEVSCSEVDELVEDLTRHSGVLGARMTGGGFGGCVVALVRRESTEDVLRCLSVAQPPRRVLIASGSEGARIEALDTYHRGP